MQSHLIASRPEITCSCPPLLPKFYPAIGSFLFHMGLKVFSLELIVVLIWEDFSVNHIQARLVSSLGSKSITLCFGAFYWCPLITAWNQNICHSEWLSVHVWGRSVLSSLSEWLTFHWPCLTKWDRLTGDDLLTEKIEWIRTELLINARRVRI